MEESQCAWTGRTVLVAGSETMLGAEVARQLLARGARVVGLVRDRAAAAPFAREIAEKRFRVVHGRVEDAVRFQSTLAIHEVSAIFSLGTSAAHHAAVFRAAQSYYSRLPVVAAVSGVQLRIAEDPSPFPYGFARFGELFGPGDSDRGHVVARTALAQDGEDAAAVPDGAPRDFVYAPDAARACLLTAERAAVEGHSLDFTFRSGWVFSAAAMAGLIAMVREGRPIVVPSATSDNPASWRPALSLAEALAATVKWYQEWAEPGAAAFRRAA